MRGYKVKGVVGTINRSTNGRGGGGKTSIRQLSHASTAVNGDKLLKVQIEFGRNSDSSDSLSTKRTNKGYPLFFGHLSKLRNEKLSFKTLFR
jgi:hypothetical protein